MTIYTFVMPLQRVDHTRLKGSARLAHGVKLMIELISLERSLQQYSGEDASTEAVMFPRSDGFHEKL